MALHRKFSALLSLKPDIAIVSECANPHILRSKMNCPDLGKVVWIGDNPNKGLGVFAFNGHDLKLVDTYSSDIRHIAPVRVSGRNVFNLLAVWAINTKSDGWSKDCLAPLLRSMDRYDAFLKNGRSVVAGDFNNHVRWDKPGWVNNHANAITRLSDLGLVSAYHSDRDVSHGSETEPTIYWRDRRKDGPTYHIDYIFIPESWRTKTREMTVGTFNDWCANKLSDHVPLVVEVSNL